MPGKTHTLQSDCISSIVGILAQGGGRKERGWVGGAGLMEDVPVSQPVAPLELPRQAVERPPQDAGAPWVFWPNLCSCCVERDKEETDEEGDEDALPPGETGPEADFDRLQLFMQHTSQEAIRDSYDFSDEIGKGACGVVFHAKHKLTGKTRAVKLISKEKVRHAFRFRREIEIMKRIAHPNITQLVETFEDRNYIYMVIWAENKECEYH